MNQKSEIRFLVNLRNETATQAFRDGVRPYGWLLPPAFATRTTKTYARQQAEKGSYVLADNGLFDDLARIAQEFDGEALPIRSKIKVIRDQVGGSPSRSEIPDSLMFAARDIADLSEVQIKPLRDSHSERAINLSQLGLTAFVGAEDSGPGVWLRLGIGPEGLGFLSKDWRRIGRGIAKAAAKDKRVIPADMGYFPVASPIDEASGKYFGDEFAKENLDEVAIAFGALVRERRFSSRIIINQRAVLLPRNLPGSYVKSIVTLKAFLDSYKRRSGDPPKGLHLLGLGSPILIGLAALLCKDTSEITLDATSPIRDASRGILYSGRPTLLKLNPNSVAMKILTDRRRNGWPCKCRFCRSFHETFPQNAVAAREAWNDIGSPEDLRLHLTEGEPLGDALPLLSLSRSGGQRGKEARKTRIGHNHWALTKLCSDLTRHLQNRTIENYMEDIIQKYNESASPVYAAAVRWAYDYIIAD